MEDHYVSQTGHKLCDFVSFVLSGIEAMFGNGYFKVFNVMGAPPLRGPSFDGILNMTCPKTNSP